MMGALYLDSDLVTVRDLVLTWFEPLLSVVNIKNIPRDYKSHLQEMLQAKELPTPHYEIVREDGPDHAKVFFVRCAVPSLQKATEGKGHSKKTAEQEAARVAFLTITQGETK